MTDKEKAQEFSTACIIAEKKFYSSLPPREKEQYDAMREAGRLLKEKQVPFWLFAEVPVSEDCCNYARSQWCPTQGFNADGSITKSSTEFIAHHISALCWHLYSILIPSVSKNIEKEMVAPAIMELFFTYAGKYEKHLEVTRPIQED